MLAFDHQGNYCSRRHIDSGQRAHNNILVLFPGGVEERVEGRRTTGLSRRGRTFSRFAARDGIQNQGINWPQLLLHLLHHRAHLLRVIRAGLERDSTPAECLNGLDHFSRPPGAAMIIHANRRSMPGKEEGRGRANASTRPGDQRNLPLQQGQVGWIQAAISRFSHSLLFLVYYTQNVSENRGTITRKRPHASIVLYYEICKTALPGNCRSSSACATLPISCQSASMPRGGSSFPMLTRRTRRCSPGEAGSRLNSKKRLKKSRLAPGAWRTRALSNGTSLPAIPPMETQVPPGASCVMASARVRPPS